MSEYVWMCTAPMDPSLVRGLWPELNIKKPKVFPWSFLEETWSMNEMGVSLPRDRFPEKVFHSTKAKFRASLPEFFHSGFIFLNEKAQDVFYVHDLGGGALYPVDLYEHDEVTPIPAKIRTLCIGNQKDTVLLDRSPRMRQIWPKQEFYAPEREFLDDDITVDASCIEGADIWADPKVKRVFFISDRLGKSLAKVGMKKAFGLVRCTVE